MSNMMITAILCDIVFVTTDQYAYMTYFTDRVIVSVMSWMITVQMIYFTDRTIVNVMSWMITVQMMYFTDRTIVNVMSWMITVQMIYFTDNVCKWYVHEWLMCYILIILINSYHKLWVCNGHIAKSYMMYFTSELISVQMLYPAEHGWFRDVKYYCLIHVLLQANKQWQTAKCCMTVINAVWRQNALDWHATKCTIKSLGKYYAAFW